MDGNLDPGSGSYIIQLLIVVIIFLLQGLVFGIFSSIIMKRKGRSVATGWILGFILGLIGFVITLILPPNDDGILLNKLKSGKYKICNSCKEVIKIDADICPFCRTTQNPQ